DPGKERVIVGDDLLFVAMDGWDDDERRPGHLPDELIGTDHEHPVLHVHLFEMTYEMDVEQGIAPGIFEIAVHAHQYLLGPFDIRQAAIAFRYEDRYVYHAINVSIRSDYSIRWGRKRLRLSVISVPASRIPMPAGCWPMTQLPIRG